MNITSLFSSVAAIWSAVSAVWPMVTALVKQVESDFPAGSTGQQKLDAVQSMLSTAWTKVSGVEASFEQAWPILEGMISALVSTYNALGLFNHKSASATGGHSGA